MGVGTGMRGRDFSRTPGPSARGARQEFPYRYSLYVNFVENPEYVIVLNRELLTEIYFLY